MNNDALGVPRLPQQRTPVEDVEVLAGIFKQAWHAADEAELPDRTHHGIEALLRSQWLANVRRAERRAGAIRAMRGQKDFFKSIDMDDAADHCEQSALAYESDAIGAVL